MVADNVLKPGAPLFLWQLAGDPDFVSEAGTMIRTPLASLDTGGLDSGIPMDGISNIPLSLERKQAVDVDRAGHV